MGSTRRTFLGTAIGIASLAGCTGNRGGGSMATPTDTATDTATATATTTKSTNGGSSLTVRTRSNPELGTILTDADGMTLYMFDKDTEGDPASTCYDGCADAWPPLTVDGSPTKGENVTATLSTFERKTGEMQVTAAGWPLYYFASDEQPGDAKGQGANDIWWVLAPDGTPIKPEATTTSGEGGGGGGRY